MLYILQQFLFFLALCLFFYYSVNERYKILVLLIASILFIAAVSLFSALCVFVFSLINYYFGKKLYRGNFFQFDKSVLFWFIIVFNILFLCFFKYIHSVFPLSHNKIYPQIPINNALLRWMVPIGISYYSFQTLGYLIRIHRGAEKPEYNFINFCLYLLYFPKIISGPVERSNHFFPQLNSLPPFQFKNISSGFELFIIGLFKKIVIADNLYYSVHNVYSNVYEYSGLSLVTVMFIHTIYIYNDFSGYTDMALGISKMFGIDLPDNFRRPFFAVNISDYWRRWHISLSTWCNDFIYNPFVVKFRKWGKKAVFPALLITFLVMGVWHGLRMTYLILGCLQAVAIFFENTTKTYRFLLKKYFPDYIFSIISFFYVFVFMSFSMIFFFADSVKDSNYFVNNLFASTDNSNFSFIPDKLIFGIALGLFLISLSIDFFEEIGFQSFFNTYKKHIVFRVFFLFSLLLLIYLLNPSPISFYYSRF